MWKCGDALSETLDVSDFDEADANILQTRTGSHRMQLLKHRSPHTFQVVPAFGFSPVLPHDGIELLQVVYEVGEVGSLLKGLKEQAKTCG